MQSHFRDESAMKETPASQPLRRSHTGRISETHREGARVPQATAAVPTPAAPIASVYRFHFGATSYSPVSLSTLREC